MNSLCYPGIYRILKSKANGISNDTTTSNNVPKVIGSAIAFVADYAAY